MRILICSEQASELLPLLTPLDATHVFCGSAEALLTTLTDDIDAVLLDERVLAGCAESLLTGLRQVSVPILLLGAATVDGDVALPGSLIVERPFTSRALCSGLLMLLDRNAADSPELRSREEVLALQQSQRMDAVESVIDGVAHDFNNMLTGVIGALDIMKRHVAAGRFADLPRFIEAASISADRASALTQRLLTLSHRQPLEALPIEVGPLLESLEGLIRRSVSEGIKLRGDYQHGAVRVLADARQLESAILNLAVNARDAMPDGGRIDLHTSVVDLTAETCAALPDLLPGRYLLIALADTGEGMSSDTLERVFDPFFTTKSVGQGSGLGLSMVHGFARQSGGQVTIHSEPAIGTTVRLYLPVVDKPGMASQEPVSGLPRSGPQARILLVEGDSSVCLLVAEVASERGYQLVNAAAPQAALELLDAEAFDLLITDVSLPGTSGIQLAEAAARRQPALAVLLVAAAADVGQLALAPELRSIAKPFSMRELSETLGDMLAVQG
ncbi:ATP-binding protein [Phytopseudomonas punonensis]|uniref:histidine kinase n=1 Tax=Phytopseudomonas punonensis TaxID=1220495 RepID=A0A1M7GGQ2_9GAMM|nr:ATP-binding protein [Pseudomonas punonensis]SHM15308.1 His Kinase A (phospho-acceptor) domain-containing protein [Pseudomonas punonensis]